MAGGVVNGEREGSDDREDFAEECAREDRRERETEDANGCR